MGRVSQLLVAALAYSHFAIAADQDDEYKVKGNYAANNATTPMVKEGDHYVHFVTVGKATNNFKPNSIVANPGDIVMFQFYPTNHSVIKAAYGYPCIPYDTMYPGEDSFYSEFHPVSTISDDPPSWNLTINDTRPIFYYCGATGSCNDWGMVGGINLNGSTPLSNQIGLARKSDYMLLPGEPFPDEAAQASLISLAATATTATFTVTQQPSEPSGESYDPYYEEEHHDSGLSPGAVAGIAVGSAIGALAAVGLIWLMLRTRSLKKRLDAQQTQQNQAGIGPQSPMAPYGQAGWTSHQSRQMSGLPPYQTHDAGTDMYKPPDSEGYPPSDVPSRGMSPHQASPYNMQGQFVGFQGDPRSNRFTGHSELSGTVPPMVELAAPRPNSPEYNPRYQ